MADGTQNDWWWGSEVTFLFLLLYFNVNTEMKVLWESVLVGGSRPAHASTPLAQTRFYV